MRKINKGDRVVIVATKPPRKRKKSNPEYYAQSRSRFSGIVIKRSDKFKFRGIKAYEVLFKRFTNPKIYYEDEIVHILDSESRRESRNQYRTVKVWRDSRGVKRCGECGKELEEDSKRVWCANCTGKVAKRRHDSERGKREERREYRKNYCREWRRRKKKEGLCERCGKEAPEPGLTTCYKCRQETLYYRNI